MTILEGVRASTNDEEERTTVLYCSRSTTPSIRLDTIFLVHLGIDVKTELQLSHLFNFNFNIEIREGK